jgi:hypothetical protein
MLVARGVRRANDVVWSELASELACSGEIWRSSLYARCPRVVAVFI